MAKNVSKLLSIVLVAALALSLAVAAIWDQPAQALTADEITAAQTAAATELANAQARADKAWNALQALPTPEEVKADPTVLPDTCPYCGRTTTYKPTSNSSTENRKVLEWIVLDGETDEAISVSGMNRSGHIYLTGDVTYTADVSTESNCFITAGYGPAITCIFTNGYNITSQDAGTFFLTTSKMNIIAWDRNDRTKSSVFQGDGNEGAIENGAVLCSNGGTDDAEAHIFGGTFEKYAAKDSSNKANVVSAHANSGKFYFYDGVTVNGGTHGSAVYINGDMSFGRAQLHMYGGTINGGTGDEAVEIEASTKTGASSKKTTHYAGVYMYDGVINGGKGYSAVSTIDIKDGNESKEAATYSTYGKKDCQFYMYGGTINAYNNNRALRIGTTATDARIYGGTVNGGDLSENASMTAGSVAYNGGGKLTVAGGKLIAGGAKNGGAIYAEKAATVTVSGGEIIGANTSNGGAISISGEESKLNITGGKITGCDGNYGAAIYCSAADVTMTGGTVTGGTAITGGAIYCTGEESKLTITGGTITGGTVGVQGTAATKAELDAAIEAGTVESTTGIASGTGGTGGNIYISKGELTIGGTARIENGTAYSKLTAKYNKASGGSYTVEYANGAGGNISAESCTAVTISGGTIIGGKAENLAGNMNISSCSNVTISGGTISGGEIIGNNGGGGGGNLHIGSCTTTISGGTITGGKITTANPQGGNIRQTGGTLNMTGGTISEGACLVRGGNYNGTTGAVFNLSGGELLNGTANYGGNIGLYNCKLNISGTAKITGGTAADSGGALYCPGGVTASSVGVTMTGGTISGGSAKQGGNVFMGKNWTMTMDAGTITGGQASAKGGNVYMEGAVPFTMNGGTISDGGKYNGGNLYVTGSATFTMNDGTISGGNTTYGGGSIYLASGNFHLVSGTISGGTSGSYGGNFYIENSSKMTMTGGTVTEGTATGNNGGNFYITKVTGITLTSGTISDGVAKGAGGNICLHNSGLTLESGITVSDGIAENSTSSGQGGGNLSVRGGSTLTTSAIITGGKTLYDKGAGGNINLGAKDTMIMNGGVIAMGRVEGTSGDSWGGNIRAYSGTNGSPATVTINAGLIYGGYCAKNTTSANIGIKGYDVFNLNGGTICGDVAVGVNTTCTITGAPQVVKTMTVDGTQYQNSNCGLYLESSTASKINISGMSTDAYIRISKTANKAMTVAYEGASDLLGCFMPLNADYCVTVKDNILYYTAHAKTNIAQTAATCTESGYAADYKYCATCAQYYNADCTQKVAAEDVVIPALGHKYTGVETTAPTCEGKGVMTYTCQNDASHTYTEEIAATGHNYEAVVTAPTCEADGYTTHTCKNDPTHTYVDSTVAALGHKYTGVETTAPTCEGKGVMTYTCANDASHTYTEEIAATGHNYEAVVTAPTCEADGYTTYTCKNDPTHTYVDSTVAALGHKYTGVETTAPTCEGKGVMTYTCATCGDSYTEEIAATGHNYKAVVTAPTCEADGYTTHTCKNDPTHTYVDSTVAALGHKYNEKVTTAPSCTEAGEKTFTCANGCGESYTEEIAATGHSIVLLTPAQAPANCVTPGKAAVYTCTVCYCYFEDAEGQFEQDSEVPGMIFPDGHQLTFVDASAATCEASGIKAHYLCSACGGTYAEEDDYATETMETVIPALGHKYTNYIYNNDATYDADGTETATCDNGCGTTDTRIAEGTKIPGVFKIGEERYATLQAAIEAAQPGDTIIVLTDVAMTAPVTIAKDKQLTLNLNGFTVSYTSNVPGEDMITVRGSLTIEGEGKITYTNTDTTASNVTVSTISAEPGSTVVINSGVIENKSVKASDSSIYPYAIDILTNGNLGDVTVTINGGTVYSDYMAIRQFNNGTACKNTLTVNGGHIYGASRAIQVHLKNNAAYTTISGGTIEAGGYSLCLYPTDATNIAITGGTFIGTVYSGTNGIISGGNFDREPYAGYCANGFVAVENADGSYGIVERHVASIGNVKYASLEKAIEKAVAGDTIVLLEDVETTFAQIPAGVTLNLNGYTVSGTVLGKLAINGGDLITAEGYKMIGANADYYKTSDAVIDMTATEIEIVSGTVTLAQSWWTTVGHTLTIGEAATFVIPEGIQMNVNGSTVLVEGAVVNNGAIRLMNGAVANGTILGKLILENGDLITAEGYKMIGANADYYKTSNAVINMTATEIEIVSGTVTLAQSWWTAAGQTLTIGEAATFVIPEGMNLNVNGSAVVVAGTAVVDGSVTLYSKDATIQAVEGLNVVTDAGDMVWYNEGVYRVHDHSYTNYIYNNDATFEADGTETAACDNGCSITDTRTAEGTKIPAVALIGDAKYATLQAAIDAAQNGETIVLLEDITVESSLSNAAKGLYNIAAGQKITIDLNGKTINVTDNSAGNFIVFYSYGDLTIKNGTVNLTATKDRQWNAQSTIILNRGGNLTIESGSYIHNGGTAMAITVDNSANSYGDAMLTVAGGEIKSAYTAIRNRMANPALNGNPGNGVADIVVTGGTIIGGSRGIWGQITDASSEKMGSLAITGGTIEGGNQAINIGTDGSANIDVTISGTATVKGALKGEGADFAISGGIFTAPVAEELCAEGYIPAENGDGTYGVAEDPNAAKIGDTKYATLQEALAAAKAGETVKLLKNVDASSEIILLMNGVELDLNGKELKANYLIATTGGSEIIDSGNGQGILILAKQNLTIINPDCLPVWCEAEGGYRFSQVKAYIHEKSKSADSLVLWYWFEECALDAALKSELENVAENGIKVVLRVEYTTNDGSQAVLDIIVPDYRVVEYAQIADAPHFATTIRGLNDLGDATITVLATYGKIEIAGATYTYEAV